MKLTGQIKRQPLPALPHFRIEPSRGWISLRVRELWDYRELIYFFIWRDLKVRYKQTILGVSWAVLQPFLTMVIFSVFFGNLAKIIGGQEKSLVGDYCAPQPRRSPALSIAAPALHHGRFWRCRMAKEPRKSTEPASPKPLPKGRTIVKDGSPGLEDPRLLRPGPGDPTENIDLEAEIELPQKPATSPQLAIRRRPRRG